MKTRLIFFLALLAYPALAQLPLEDMEEVKVPQAATTTIVIDQPLDSSYAFLCQYGFLRLKAQHPVPRETETVITGLHTFTDKESYDTYQKEGKTFYNSYDFAVPAKWKLYLKALNDSQTSVGFQLLSYYLDSTEYNYSYAKNYKRYRQIVSNGNIEGLTVLQARMHFVRNPITSVTFSRTKGYDNATYRYDHFIPGNSFKEQGVWHKSVPRGASATGAGPEFIVYAKSSGTLSAIREPDLKISWKQQVPVIPKTQNYNEFTLAGGTVYLASNKGSISAIDASSGELYWQCYPAGISNEDQVIFFGQQLRFSTALFWSTTAKIFMRSTALPVRCVGRSSMVVTGIIIMLRMSSISINPVSSKCSRSVSRTGKCTRSSITPVPDPSIILTFCWIIIA